MLSGIRAMMATTGGELTRVNHLRSMLDSNLDYLVSGKIGANGCVLPALTNDVGLVGLC
jgi:hypothetical protein